MCSTGSALASCCCEEPDGIAPPSAFDAFLAAAIEADSGSDTALHAWLGAAADRVNADIVVPAHGKNAAAENRGSPLLIACEMDLPGAVRVLMAAGADPFYAHPAEHCNNPILRCAEMGYSECLLAVLAAVPRDAGDAVAALETRDYKLVLGQQAPLYEAGGRGALLLAAEAGRHAAVDVLLGHPGGLAQIHRVDSFGRTPLQAAFEMAATKDAGSVARADLDRICGVLCRAAGLDPAEAAVDMLPDHDVAIERRRDRSRQLRSRWLANSQAKQAAKRADGLAAVAAKYTALRLHPHVFRPRFGPDALHAAAPVGPDGVALTSAAAVAAIDEPLPGTFTFPLLSETFCANLYAELQHYEATARGRPELGLPLYIRHDGNFGSLQDCGFAPVLSAVEHVFQPLVAQLMPGKGRCDVYHAFLTRNWVGRDENATFKIHCDKSDLTFNICLHASHGFSGSTVGFYRNTGVDGDDGRPAGVYQPTEEDRVFTYTHEVGRAVMHDGAQWHKTDIITGGTRASLIVWARLVAE